MLYIGAIHHMSLTFLDLDVCAAIVPGVYESHRVMVQFDGCVWRYDLEDLSPFVPFVHHIDVSFKKHKIRKLLT